MMRIGLLFLFNFHISVSLFAQVPDIVQTAGIKTSLHKKGIGKIFFTNKFVPGSALKETDFLQTYTLTNKSNLFFIAFLDNSVTNYMHRLAPALTSDSLVKIGNYQFTLIIDGKQVYQSNLFPGAPYPKIQDTSTIINRPFIDNDKGAGSWSESFWNRFLNNGGNEVLTEGNHTLRMEIRPYVQTNILLVGELIADGELNLQVLRNPIIDASKIRLNRPMPYDGFAVSTESFDQNKGKRVEGKNQ